MTENNITDYVFIYLIFIDAENKTKHTIKKNATDKSTSLNVYQ